jgi:hypothetical protein
MDALERQVKVSKMLGMAFVLSITGIFGIGSLIALLLGWKALLIIHGANGSISGRFVAWRCILAGALGTLIFPPLTIGEILKQLK